MNNVNWLAMASPVSSCKADRETRISASHIVSPNGILRMSETRFIGQGNLGMSTTGGRSANAENGTPIGKPWLWTPSYLQHHGYNPVQAGHRYD